MNQIPCFLLEDMHRSRYSLRRYSEAKCALPAGYHNEMGPIVATADDDPSKPDYHGTNPPAIAQDDPRWPKACACGYVFLDSDKRQLFAHPLYTRADSGVIIELRHAPAGAMWDASWWPSKGVDGTAWSVRLPDGSDWMTEGGAANCICRTKEQPPEHRCWTRSGVAPKLTVSPSLQTPRWHGWLRDGVLVTA